MASSMTFDETHERRSHDRRPVSRVRLTVAVAVMALLIALLGGGLWGFNHLREQGTAAYFASMVPPPTAVAAAPAESGPMPRYLAGIGSLTAVRDLGFEIGSGEVLGFLGPNGAGKSTTMKMITGFLSPTSGTALINGHDIVEDSLAARRCMGYLPEGAPAYGEMTVRAFLEFVAEARGFSGAERRRRAGAAIERLNLAAVPEQTVETLSKGFKRRVGLAQAILHDPRVLVMDEPTDGLDPNQKHEVRTLIREMGRSKAIVLSTHILEEVEAVCTRAIIITRGRIVFDGKPAELEAQAPANVTKNRMDWVFRKLTSGEITSPAPEEPVAMGAHS